MSSADIKYVVEILAAVALLIAFGPTLLVIFFWLCGALAALVVLAFDAIAELFR